MSKYYGNIGFAASKETAPGVWKDSILELPYFGDTLKKSTRWRNGSGINDDLEVSTRVSIVADEYIIRHFSKIKYCEYMDERWKVTEVDASSRPRIILTLGDVWNGETPETSSGACGLSGD